MHISTLSLSAILFIGFLIHLGTFSLKSFVFLSSETTMNQKN
uniref:Uncharacterized protein n=1 Tax=Onchocerca volvulus TaxID=6282 RepID=A0A8R1U362_ONCVO